MSTHEKQPRYRPRISESKVSSTGRLSSRCYEAASRFLLVGIGVKIRGIVGDKVSITYSRERVEACAEKAHIRRRFSPPLPHLFFLVSLSLVGKSPFIVIYYYAGRVMRVCALREARSISEDLPR